jgi:hypothetical protein
VRIYSRALTAAEIISDMEGNVADFVAPERVADDDVNSQRALPIHELVHTLCEIAYDLTDKYIPIAAARGAVCSWRSLALASGFRVLVHFSRPRTSS